MNSVLDFANNLHLLHCLPLLTLQALGILKNLKVNQKSLANS